MSRLNREETRTYLVLQPEGVPGFSRTPSATNRSHWQTLPLLLPRPLPPLPLLRLILLLPPTPVSLPQTPHAPLQALCIPCKEPIQLIRLHHRGQLDLFTLQPMLF